MAKYMYVPGLARADKTVSGTAFATKVKETFGSMHKFEDTSGRTETDDFMHGAVQALKAQDATGLDCTVNLNWVQIAASDRASKSKAFKVLGAAQDNMLKRTEGQTLRGAKKKEADGTETKIVGQTQGTKELKYDAKTPATCMAAEYLAQVMPPPPKQAKPNAANEQKPAPKPGALCTLQAGDVLYIIGHGNQLGGTMTFKCPAPLSHQVKKTMTKQDGCEALEHVEKWYIDPLTLASLLRAEGLPTTHKLVELIMCFSAGLSLPDEQLVQPYAQRLAGALTGLGYNKIEVRGAKGIVSGGTLAINPSLTAKEDGCLHVKTDKSEQVKPGDARYAGLKQTFKGK